MIYFCFDSSSKSIQGLEPSISEECGIKLSLSDKFNFVGPLTQENANEKIEGLILFIYYLDCCMII
jgi:hypothetical protein